VAAGGSSAERRGHQSGNLRCSEDLLGEVVDAFARIEDPASRK
jgi:hypothetical protein